jgi:hypothetical protein
LSKGVCPSSNEVVCDTNESQASLPPLTRGNGLPHPVDGILSVIQYCDRCGENMSHLWAQGRLACVACSTLPDERVFHLNGSQTLSVPCPRCGGDTHDQTWRPIRTAPRSFVAVHAVIHLRLCLSDERRYVMQLSLIPPAPNSTPVCHLSWYELHAVYYVSMAFSCAGAVTSSVYQDPVTASAVVWHMCSGHAERLTTCHIPECEGRISPYNVMHTCVRCMAKEH